MSMVYVKVVVDSAHMHNQDIVRQGVSAAGMIVDRTIPEIGAMFGSADESRIEFLQRVEGVLRAQPEGGCQLPPLDPDIPQ